MAAGGSARASSASVTDAGALHDLFGELAAEHGGLDAVVNVAGITRQSYLGRGSEEDWRSLLAVHLDGYLNVLHAALPLMAAAGHGRILGRHVGLGLAGRRRGWLQPREAGRGRPYLAARSLRPARRRPSTPSPPSPTPAWWRRRSSAPAAAGKAGGGGGLSLSASMPGPEDLGPLGAHLVGDGVGWCNGPGSLHGRIRRSRSSTSPGSSRWCEPTGSPRSPLCSRQSSRGAFVTAETGTGEQRWHQPSLRADLRRAASPPPRQRSDRTAAGQGTRRRPGGRPGLAAVADRGARGPVRRLSPDRARPRLRRRGRRAAERRRGRRADRRRGHDAEWGIELHRPGRGLGAGARGPPRDRRRSSTPTPPGCAPWPTTPPGPPGPAAGRR